MFIDSRHVWPFVFLGLALIAWGLPALGIVVALIAMIGAAMYNYPKTYMVAGSCLMLSVLNALTFTLIL